MSEILHTAVDINFPDGVARCGTCQLMETYARKSCRRTGELITDDRVYGYWCPLCVVDPNTGKIRRLGNGWNE